MRPTRLFARPSQRRQAAARNARPQPPSVNQEATEQLLFTVLFRCPTMLEALDWRSLGVLPMVCRRWRKVFQDEDLFRLVCDNMARQEGLYFPKNLDGKSGKDVFLDILWPVRDKWRASSVAQDARIQVSVRFRPGERKREPLVLPLSQMLQFRNINGVEMARPDPLEFLDPMTNHVMRDPVSLPTSGKVMERKIIEAHLRHKETDPFNDQPLTIAQLQPCPELRQRIQVWRKEREETPFISVAPDVVDEIVDSLGDALSPDLLQVLADAKLLTNTTQQLRAAEARAAWALSGGDGEGAHVWHGEAEEGEAEVAVGDLRTFQEANVAGNQGNGDAPLQLPQHQFFQDNDDDDDAVLQDEVSEAYGDSYMRKQETSTKVLAIKDTRVVVYAPSIGLRQFMFPHVYLPDVDQETVYRLSARDTVLSFINGFNGCVMCYGQTGSGKTHTVFGPPDVLERHLRDGEARVGPDSGITYRILEEIMNAREAMKGQVTTKLYAQYIQIYANVPTCLLSASTVIVSRGGHIRNAVRVPIDGLRDAMELLRKGEENKRYEQTFMNVRSSRAHTVLILSLSQQHLASGLMTQSTLHVVDLAGSERLHKSGARGDRQMEAITINYSLLALGKCITALVEQRPHVPYFDSRLTTLLEPALGGNARTSIVVNCHLDDVHGAETIATLRFGERCSVVTNQLKLAATSIEDVAEGVRTAMALCERQMRTLEQSGKQHLPGYARLARRYQQLRQKRAELGF